MKLNFEGAAISDKLKALLAIAGLATWAPTDPQLYRENGKRLVEDGYVQTTKSVLENAEK